jgi:hypothetical protein
MLLATAVIAAVAATTLVRSRADAHGDLDQFLAGDPGCLAAVLRASAPSSSTLRQQFVPSDVPGGETDGLQSVDVCLTLASSANVILNVRSGTLAAPGSLLATSAATGVLSGTRWVHFELTNILPITPGDPYLLELSGFPAFSWRGTCGMVAGACTSIDTDLYPPGSASASPGVLDFAFRTYAALDNDLDGVANPIDNCIDIYNPDQLNSDANFIDLTPPKAVDDLTWINSDEYGDACDDDDDNDGIPDVDELSGAACGGIITNPILRDTDDDRFLDRAECLLGTDPTDPNDKPTPAACIAHLNISLSTDSDGDKIRDYVEFCFYNSDPYNPNTDGDVCADGKEVASVNNDTTVNVADLGLVASEYGQSPPKLRNMDVNKDGVINPADLGIVASLFGPC